MDHLKSQALNGKNNKRINKVDELENEGTAAWADTERTIPESNVSVPDTDAVIRAKNWVDNGSRL